MQGALDNTKIEQRLPLEKCVVSKQAKAFGL